jgi:hypothetical protein
MRDLFKAIKSSPQFFSNMGRTENVSLKPSCDRSFSHLENLPISRTVKVDLSMMYQEHSALEQNRVADELPAARKPVARLLAFYLPQFHPIPQNDAWWGKGFTEWTNVTKAKPLFLGHRQPHLPSDLGFYDLRVPEVRQAQAELAREYGVEGFCYWHYWFGNGERILERPFAEVLASGKPDFPFCLAWANQSWSGIWHGNPRSILLEQTYPGEADERAHFELLLPAFLDARHIRVDGKPLFLVFNPDDLPDWTSFINHWQRLAAENGLPGIYFVAMSNDYHDPALKAFDAITSHPPGDFLRKGVSGLGKRIINRLKKREFGPTIDNFFGNRLRLPARYKYSEVVDAAFNDLPDNRRFLPCVLPNWDNTSRSSFRGLVFEDSTPELFGAYLAKAVDRVSSRPVEERIIFVKAWNEWAEGNYLEPDREHGRAYLEAMQDKVLPSDVTNGSRAKR